MGVPGIYTFGDPQARNDQEKQGIYPLGIGKVWIKSPHLTAGQCPVMAYHRELMMAILNDRMPYLTPLLNTQFISLDQAPEAYQQFDKGAPVKFVIDPHGSIGAA